jgi:Tfp pilus assembly protein PilN
MRAVNLIPSDQRRGAGSGSRPVRSYVVIGALAVLVVLASLYAVAGRRVSDRKAELARVTAQAERAEAKAGALAPYARFAELSAKRVQTVTSLAESRFDWAHVMHEVGRVIPDDAWLTSLTGTVSPGVALEGSGSGTGSLRSALGVPALEITGCTTSQSNVARMMSRMRLIDGVTRVALNASEKGEPGAGGGSGGGSGGDCRHGSSQFPQFSMVVYFAQRPATATTTPGTTTKTPVAQTTAQGGSR